jgi:hypothetical protein
MKYGRHGGMILAGETEELEEEICPSATLPITNTIWIKPGRS